MNFELRVLGTGSAVPSYGRFSSSQVLHTHSKDFMIDCADGTQYQLRRLGVKNTRLGHIFISHLHGDHCFGLIALISTMSMLHHTNDIYIHAHPDLERLLQPQLDYFCYDLPFKVIFEPFDPLQHSTIYEDRSLTVETIPLVHSVPTSGFLFREKPSAPHLNKERLAWHGVGLAEARAIKEGADFTRADGTVIPRAEFLTAPTPSKSYAYCCDTYYSERIIPIIEGVDVLFHEATFAQAESHRCKNTLHSTAKGAASIAAKAHVKQLIISHFSARYPQLDHLLDEAREVFPDTLLAADGMVFQF
ncbi:MAG: ribonuclease Z [Paludibacteraceae bacterium]|nr:ribonuclease Z [Paludibacteraceae bacterium]